MNSIGLKLWGWMICLVTLLLILLWLFQIVFLESFYTDLKVQEIKKQGYQIVALITSNKYDEAQNKINILSYDNNASILAFDKNSNIIVQNDSDDTMMQMPMYRNYSTVDSINSVLNGEEVNIELIHHRFGNKFRLIGLPVPNISGALLINVPIVSIQDTVDILKKQLGIITVILFFITIIFAYFLSKSFTNPIRLISSSAEKISTGKYETRINLNSKDEIGMLSKTINNMAEGLSKVEKLRKDLISNVSHELRTPLTLIRSYAETTRDVSGDNKEKRDKNLSVIIEESERLSKMVDDILDLSKLQSGKFNLNIKEFDIFDMLSDIVSKFDIKSKETGVTIQLDDVNKNLIKADENRLKQALINLINNAFNHTPQGGTIRIYTSQLKNIIRVLIKDNGTGIPDDEINYIWDRFYKGKNHEGTGIGLSIVKSIFEAHGLNYGVNSKEGEGTSFWFDIMVK